MSLDPATVKSDSETKIRRLGGKICDWLPIISREAPRTEEGLIGRALVMNALVNIHFEAPIPIIKGWIEEHRLEHHLSAAERALLLKKNEQLVEQERVDLYWYLEALWALMWAGGLVDDLDPTRGIPDSMASLCPDLQRNESGAKFSERMHLRPYDEVYRMLDLYYRLHWWTRDGRLNGYGTQPVSLDIVMERRKALEWLVDDASDWDAISLNT